mmetsp:Transcript_30015/g.89028  ORF Transcript_30015/g.89028 Transcript_30015/m.89028 type:complete len:302 (+) Transcript_30015:1776-2681(+)
MWSSAACGRGLLPLSRLSATSAQTWCRSSVRARPLGCVSSAGSTCRAMFACSLTCRMQPAAAYACASLKCESARSIGGTCASSAAYGPTPGLYNFASASMRCRQRTSAHAASVLPPQACCAAASDSWRAQRSSACSRRSGVSASSRPSLSSPPPGQPGGSGDTGSSSKTPSTGITSSSSLSEPALLMVSSATASRSDRNTRRVTSGASKSSSRSSSDGSATGSSTPGPLAAPPHTGSCDAPSAWWPLCDAMAPDARERRPPGAAANAGLSASSSGARSVCSRAPRQPGAKVSAEWCRRTGG